MIIFFRNLVTLVLAACICFVHKCTFACPMKLMTCHIFRRFITARELFINTDKNLYIINLAMLQNTSRNNLIN